MVSWHLHPPALPSNDFGQKPFCHLASGTLQVVFFVCFFLRYAGLSMLWPLLLQSTGSGRAGPAALAHGPSSSVACGILPDRDTNPRPLHRQADSQPLRHQGSPLLFLNTVKERAKKKRRGQSYGFEVRCIWVHYGILLTSYTQDVSLRQVP